MPAREIIDEIGRIREKLLELSNRNPLLSYRKTKLKTLEFVGESPDQIYSRLVEEGKQFRFASRPEEGLFGISSENGQVETQESEARGSSPSVALPTHLRPDSLRLGGDAKDEVSVAEQHNDGLLQTSLSEARLEAVLKHIRREANSAIEETGVNFLYLVVGMLAWREDADTERTLLAPLLLIPVQVDRDFDARSKRYRYAVKWREEEVQDNLCLLKRLEKDFGMRLPRFDQDQAPEQYFAEIERSVCASNDWTVERSALIGFFSFQKLLMYLDIDPVNWSHNGALEEGSIVHDLVWGTDENAGAPLYASDYEIDNHPVANDVIFPLDADSSQHSALVDIRSGKNLVIEGPPGTGKSQTITNAIAAALHQGKSVLFVAEKLTALEVVREKLDRLGLADFCLELHSDAASPRQVYDSLRRRLEHSYPEPSRLEDLRAELQRKQQQIGDYLQVTSQIVGPYKEPLYDLMWRVTNLRALRFSRLRGADVDTKVNQAVLNENAELLDAYAETLGELDAPKESPWWGCWLDNLNPNDTEWVDEVVAAFREHAKQAETTLASFAARFGVKSLDWLDKRLQEPTNVSDLSSLVETSQKITRDCDLRPLHQNLNRKLARQLEQQLRKVGELRARVAPFLTVELAEAAKASRAICDALAPPVIKMFTHSVLSDLKVCVQILDPLYQRLKYAGAVPLSAISREKLCGKVTKLLGDDPSYTLHAINECGKHFEEEAARLDSQTQQGVSKWFANLTKMHETSLAISRLSNDAPRACADRDLTVLACQQGQELLQEFLQQVHTLRDIDATLLPRVKQQSVDTQSRAMAALEIIGSQLDNLRAETTWSELQRFAAPEIRMAAKRCQQLTRELASLWSELSKKTSADSSEAAEHAQAATLVIRNLLSAVATETTWGQLRRFLGLEPQRSARGLLAELNEYCELEKRLALRCDNVRNESYDCASVILEVLDNQFRVFSSDMLWGDLKKECSRLHAFKFALNRSAKIAEAATVQNLGPCRSIRELDAAYFKCQLTRHSAVTELTSLPPKLFSHATAQKLETGISRCSTLLDRKIQLAILIDMDDVPSFAEITSLLKSLKSEGTSFFRSLKPAYRSTRRRVAEFSRGLLPKSPAAVIERLESLRDWMQDSEAFRNDPELNEVFGDQFAGIDTDWARCKVLFQWAVTAGGRGISHAQACDMLRLRDPDQLSITEFNQNLKVLKAVIGDPGMQQLLGIGELQASQDVPLSLLIERTSYLCEAADVVGNAVSAFSVNDTDSLARVRELCKDALRVRELRERIGESTRWKALVKLAAQTDPKLTLHLDEPPPDDIKLLVSHAKELLDRVFSLSEAVRELDEWLSIFAIENTATLAEIKSLCEFVRRYSVIEEELADQLCWKPIASLCTSLVKPFRDLEQSERCHMAARGSQSAISDLLAIIEQIGDAVDELREHLSCFVIRDEDTLGDCKQFLLAVIERNAVSEKIRDARLWQGLGNLYHSIDSPIDELEELHRWCECLAKLDLPQELLDWLLVDDTSEKVAKLAAGIERFRLRVEPWQANLQNAALLLTWIDSIGAPLADGLQQATHLVNDDSEKLEDVLTRCRLVLETHRAEEEITNQKKWGSLGDLYRGVNSDPSEIAVAIEWTSVLAKIQLPESISTVLARGQTNKSCAELAEWCDELAAAHCGWLRCRKRFEQVGEVSADWMPWRLPTLGSSALSSIAARVLERASDLPAWAAFCRMRGLCQTAGLTDFANAVLDKTVPPDRISGVYRLTLLEAIAEEKIADSGLSRTFSRTAIEKARRKYRELDRELLFVNRSLVAHHASQHQHFAPAGNCTGRVGDYTEMGLIRHEIQKQRRHCRIRDLLTRAGNAAQALKPCFMMSPLSVSQYLDPEGIQFDLVVMDEASQIKPEDAIGVLLRAKQIVVVGDPKQLPPSSYFDRVSSDVADDDATQYDNTESILEVAMKAFQPIRRLRWHYRSLHESLIHFSNDRFYDGDLVVFPSPSTDEGALGLRFHYVEGASFDKGANRVEAERVAQAIVNHAKVNPQESLAVASFNAKQSGLIQDLLESLCVKDEEARFAVELLNGNERLLIKNLENLQGDERDVVFISYTYGPDPASGRVMNRFGPIAGEAGWRRLNVMVSRARRRVEVFSSIRHSDIQSGLSKSRGVTAFRDYLEYVQTGFLPDRAVITDRPMDSPLEEAVARAITSLGYEVVPQVGVAGYFIDFGIRLPGQQDFFLGVECDGATYHSSKSARDRDRLREEVICSRGWELHRIWSTDWYLNQKHEEERLAKRIAELVDHVEHD